MEKTRLLLQVTEELSFGSVLLYVGSKGQIRPLVGN